ncbi:hypothetical protein MsAc7_03200 [Methanolapillus millepedarum]|uniref:Uncharacterized protein n=1 Tax=Methanolapillus millepedarum TaxID=3028296 RepID=A0AA96V3I9_9EURY|nr:hypothetical protein MsAc7_03200 [Methanosarcinaceae archaeon Ac7]
MSPELFFLFCLIFTEMGFLLGLVIIEIYGGWD